MDLNHLHLMVKDLHLSQRFYERLFGFQLKAQYGPQLIFLQNEAGFDLALSPATSVERLPQGVHFGFSVEDRDAMEAHFERAQSEFPECAFAHGPQDHGNWGSVTIQDPDGYPIEIYWDRQLH